MDALKRRRQIVTMKKRRIKSKSIKSKSIKSKSIKRKSIKNNTLQHQKKKQMYGAGDDMMMTPQKVKQTYLDEQKEKEKKIKELENKVKSPIQKLNCSPKKKQNDFTCYDEEQLNKIKDMWNEKYTDNNKKIHATDKKEIWVALMDKMKNVCNNEMCWLKQQFVDNNISTKILKDNFAPQSPKSWKKNPNEWLSNFDLKAVMKQYENEYKDFYFIGPSPIDFDTKISENDNKSSCVLDDLCAFNLQSYIKKGKEKIGIIFNTDPHNEGGTHWISLFINVPERYVYFFNSTGESIPDEIDVLVKRIIKQSKKLGKELKFSQNAPKQHQKGGSECGMYSLYFIINVLKGTVEPSFFKTKTIKDEEVQEFRKIFFNPAL